MKVLPSKEAVLEKMPSTKSLDKFISKNLSLGVVTFTALTALAVLVQYIMPPTIAIGFSVCFLVQAGVFLIPLINNSHKINYKVEKWCRKEIRTKHFQDAFLDIFDECVIDRVPSMFTKCCLKFTMRHVINGVTEKVITLIYPGI